MSEIDELTARIAELEGDLMLAEDEREKATHELSILQDKFDRVEKHVIDAYAAI